MRDLLYRLPRFSVDFPVDVIVGEIAILGLCKNISETGMRGEFRQRLPLQTEGLIRLNHPQQSMEIRGRMIHFARFDMAFLFLFQSEAERRRLYEFARSVMIVGASLRKTAPAPRGMRYLPTTPPDRRYR